MLKLSNITLGYGADTVVASGLSFKASAGECIFLCGANGSGKSTLMKTIAGQCAPLNGEITAEDAAMVPTRIPKVKGFTLKEFIRTSCGWSAGMAKKRDDEAVLSAMESLGILDLAGRDISTLSDGEFQKACIAAAMARKVSVLLLDEPTAFLDADSRISVLRTLRNLASERGICIIFSSHDIQDSCAVATRILGIGLDRRLHDSLTEGRNAVIAACFRNITPPAL